jgi:hypothetical protein
MSGEARQSQQSTQRFKVTGTSPDVGPEPAAIKITGEMALQTIDGRHATECAPQELLQLVGFRDPTVRAEMWHRPRRSGSNCAAEKRGSL